MERRFLPKLHDRGKRGDGVFCTLWEGWKCRKDMKIKIMYRGQPKFSRNTSDMRIPKGPGVYAILYYPSRADDSRPYVSYIGVAGKDIEKELLQTFKRFDHDWNETKIAFAFAGTGTAAEADEWEYYLIRYYCPPWNTRFCKQARVSLAVA